jgi:UDP-N-acetylglucosamine 2-epimerase (non-hydrolysing)
VNDASSSAPYRILCIVGARPNFMKIAPIIAALKEHHPNMESILLHTGQHYDVKMSHQYFEDLGIPQPDINLEVGSGSHAVQTAAVMHHFEPALEAVQPAAVLVVGDVNSTLACALVATKKGVPVIHVEAGLRSFDRAMPEEINRILTDQISDLLFTTESSGRDNLIREGIDDAKIRFVGNVMIDTLRRNLPRATPMSRILDDAGSADFDLSNGYGVLTLHRPSNVDNADTLSRLLEAVHKISRTLPIVFPLHPRTRTMIEKFGMTKMIEDARVLCVPPLGYLEMLGLMKDARIVLTDSGGIQEETTALGVPCITLRESTERPITVDEGTNTVVGTDSEKILATFGDIMKTGGKSGRIPEFWDGNASVRIAREIRIWLDHRKS